MVSVKLEIVVQEWKKHLCLFALLTQLSCQWSDLQREPQQHNLPTKFYQNKDGNFCLCCCRCSTCLFSCRSGRRQSIVWIACPASVVRVMRGASVAWLHFLLFLCEFFIAWFVVLDVLVVGDLRHEYAQSTWGFLFRGPPGCWLCLSRLRRGNWHSFDNDCCCGVSIVVILMTSLQCLCCVPWQGRLVAPMLIAMALFAALEGRFVLWARWRFTMMASIVSIMISDGFDRAHRDWRWCRCLLSLVVTVPSINTCVVFTARFFNSLITIQTELSLD